MISDRLIMDDSEPVKTALIKPINSEVVHQICSGQVILTLAIAVKELIENAIDAEATAINITMKEYGSELIEVSDNGTGVLEESFKALTLKHHTSKIQDFTDLQTLKTLGFRGEALSSLCALANLSVITKHDSAEHAKKISYDKNGGIIDVKTTARQTGTTVVLENLFSSLPVRRKEFMKNIKREFQKMCQLLYAYCLVSKGIRFTCTNITSSGNKNVVVTTQGNNKVRENIVSVFGAKQIASLIDVDITKPDQTILDEYNIKHEVGDEDLPFKFEFLISSVVHGCGRSSADRQFFFVNSRPVEPTKIMKLVNQTYKQFNVNQYPFVYLDVTLTSSIVDVNVTPDKRQIFLESEKLLLATIKMSLLETFKLFPSKLTIQNQDISELLTKQDSMSKRGLKRSSTDSSIMQRERVFESFRKKVKSENAIDSSFSSEFHENGRSENSNKDEQKKNTISTGKFQISSLDKYLKKNANNRVREHTSPKESFKIIEKKIDENETDLKTDSEDEKDVESSEEKNKMTELLNTLQNEMEIHCDSKSKPVIADFHENNSFEKDDSLSFNNSHRDEVEREEGEPSSVSLSPVETTKIILDSPLRKTLNNKRITLNICIDDIRKSLASRPCENENTSMKIKFRTQIAPEANKDAENELQKQIEKQDFSNMTIIGQFNLGFIITQLGHDLFIIDQHASDEKYNFETLQNNTVLQKQVLINPKNLELTPGNETILIENEHIFAKNGFHFKIDENAPSRKKVQLVAVPVSQNIVFGKDDIDEMLFMLKDSSDTMCRPSRLRAMFASRACRKSVMIGRALSRKEMKRLVDHMGEIDQPWNCPHGRPTMRHLVNLGLIAGESDEIIFDT